MRRAFPVTAFFVFVVCIAISAWAQEQSKIGTAPAAAASPSAAAPTSAETHTTSVPANGKENALRERELRLEGEKRFQTNCGRCHQAPHKFPPRVMATAIRHMRVRAMITDEDMRLILRFMTQ